MDLFASLIAFVEFLIKALVVSTALLIVLAIVVSVLPKDNPLQQLLMAFTKRLAVTVGLVGVGIPMEFIPVVDAIYDVVSVLFLGWSWFSLVWEARDILSVPRGVESTVPADAGARSSLEPVAERALYDAARTRRGDQG